jgi:hypothetical protein
MRRIGRLAYPILDSTLIPIDRLVGSVNRRYFSGKHRRTASTRRSSATRMVG